MKRLISLNILLLLFIFNASAQLAKNNPCKFLGNITTSYNWQEYCDVSDCNLTYSNYWNQATCENATKWGSVHKGWGKFDWTNADRTYNYCKQHGIKFKFHALIWGSQHPSWIENLSAQDTKKAIVEWFDEVKRHYPDLEIIDVVNEAIYSGGDYHSPYKQTKIIQALGGQTNGYPNTQSYGWIAECFKMARERWPNAILIYNDYNTFQWQKTEFINLINGLKALNAPIDAAGCQSHDLNDMGGSQFKSALEEIHNKTQMPIYITEYDIAKNDDNQQAQRYKEQFPIMWEADYVAGVTLWGWIYGKTWTSGGNSGIVKNCQDRPAFTWLKQYMQTDAARNAKSPICGSTSSISVNLELSKESVEVGNEIKITATASVRNTKVKNIEIYAGNEQLSNCNSEKCETNYSPNQEGNITIKVVAYDTDGDKSEQTATLIACKAREPFTGTAITIPGVIETENFDKGCPGIASSDSDDKDEGDSNGYRNDNGGVDIVKGNGGYAIGYTAKGEWLEYTINVESAGNYSYNIVASSGSANSGFHLEDGTGKAITSNITVPQIENDWNTYSEIKGNLTTMLKEGEQIIRLVIDGAYCNVDKITLTCTDCTNGVEEVSALYQEKTFDVYSTLGTFIGTITVNHLNEINAALYDLTNHEGAYILRDTVSGKSQIRISKK